MTESPPAVLLVDDRHDNLLALRAVLEPMELELVCAGSGVEALAALLERDFAVVVLDVQMPDMDGFETAQLIKGRMRTQFLPIIFLTAISAERSHHLAGYRVGAVDYISKPFDPDILRAKVGVFAELWRRGRLIDRQRDSLAEQLAAIDRLNAELEHSNAQLEGFAAAAAEELLEPLDVLGGMLELLADPEAHERHPLPSDLARRAADLASRQRQRVSALLDYAEAGRVPVALELVDLREAVEEALARTGLARGVAAHVVGHGEVVHGDRRQLVRVIELLIERAAHAGASSLAIAAAEDGPTSVVTFSDDGAKPSEAEAAALFSDLRSQDGEGEVGLTVARRIIERHGGSIWAAPASANGTLVSFTLPQVSLS